MPRINTYTDNTTIEDDDKLLTYDTQGAATKLTAFSRIWTWVQAKFHALAASSTAWNSNDKMIVDRNGTIARVDASIPAKNIVETYNGSTLAGTAQSVKSAIDALKSEHSYETVTNWDDFKAGSTRGIRHGVSVSASASNVPVSGDNITYYGWVEGVTNYCTQHLTIQWANTALNRNREFVRSYLNGTWTEWTEVTHGANTIVPANTDFDTMITPGCWVVSGSETYTNGPGFGGVLEVSCPYRSGVYAIQRVTSATKIAVRYRSGSSGTAFTDWKSVTLS